MARSRSRSPDRRHRRSRSPRNRDRSRDRDRERTRRSRSRDRSKDRDRERRRRRTPEPSPPPITSQHAAPPAPNPSAHVDAPAAPILPAAAAVDPAVEERRKRLEAWKAKQQAVPPSSAPPSAADATQLKQQAAGTASLKSKEDRVLWGVDDEEVDASLPVALSAAEQIAARRARADAEEEQEAAKGRARAAAHAAQMAATAPGFAPASDEPLPPEEDEVDPLDAFMAGEILPEVHAAMEADQKAKEAERIRHAELLAAGKGPAKPSVLSDSDEEPEPDARIQIPANKVKYVVGPGGETIKLIQRKSKARIQVLKDEEELNRAWGAGTGVSDILKKRKAEAEAAMQRSLQQAAAKDARERAKAKRNAPILLEGPKGEGSTKGETKETKETKQPKEEGDSSSSDDEPAAKGPNAPPRKMATLLLYGDAKAIEMAEKMIAEAVDNKAQKKQQREKEYSKKRDEKSRIRQLYHMRHTRDYDALEVPMGTCKADIKKAYRRLAMLWHPDKHPDNAEEANIKFQIIKKAYDSLMTTNEEEKIEALGHK